MTDFKEEPMGVVELGAYVFVLPLEEAGALMVLMSKAKRIRKQKTLSQGEEYDKVYIGGNVRVDVRELTPEDYVEGLINGPADTATTIIATTTTATTTLKHLL